ncbi:MAG: glycine cleavage system aminomethyltransferase GcvT [Pirellulales bacterium]
MDTTPARTPLYDWHAAHGARLVDFAGWNMPVQYTSIVAEHLATRQAAGLFDVSHMARFKLAGARVAEFLDRLVTRRVTDMRTGQVRYALVTNERGGILDDVLVYRLESAGGQEHFGIVANASNRAKIADWIRAHASPDVEFKDVTLQTGMIAVQGPRALELTQPLVGADLTAMKYYTAIETDVASHKGLVSRTGYTGEDGCELIVPAEAATSIWDRIWQAGQKIGAVAAGLGARDTLRLEAAMPLYGHELSEEIDPIEAGLDFAVSVEGRDFFGRDAMVRRRSDPTRRRRIGLLLAGKRAARQGYPILAVGRKVGEVTSGSFSPTLDRPIAMGYVTAPYHELGGPLEIDLRGHIEPAKVTSLPFYRRA